MKSLIWGCYEYENLTIIEFYSYFAIKLEGMQKIKLRTITECVNKKSEWKNISRKVSLLTFVLNLFSISFKKSVKELYVVHENECVCYSVDLEFCNK